jgi:OmcA/MtrC family decaheme c-type cytochrome
MALAASRNRVTALAALFLAAACGRTPELADRPIAPLPSSVEPAVTILSATVGVTSRLLTVEYRLADRGTPITGADAEALGARWTLAWLHVEPVSGLPAWRSLIFSPDSQTIGCLPPAGPGTPGTCVPAVPADGTMVATGEFLANRKQPGAESSGTTVELGDGRFTYTFARDLPLPNPETDGRDLLDETLRVGVFLEGTPGAARTSATLDFVPSGGVAGTKDDVTDAKCNGCHGTLAAHGGHRTGVALCITCHTWLNADPDTVDPAALNGTLAATRTKYPNPLELGRMVHRIHRGKNLPTLFRASSAQTWPPDYLSAGAPWPASAFTAVPPLPFNTTRTSGAAPTNPTAPVGTKYSIIGDQSSEVVFGRIASREANFQPARILAEGIGYPQDLRNCGACHSYSAQAGATVTSISRRTCSGCHPDVFYGEPDDAALVLPDATHLAHTGGRKVDDAACADCHVTPGPALFAPIAEIHKPLTARPPGSPYWSRVYVELVDVQHVRPGEKPVITFRISDRGGDISPLNTTGKETTSTTATPSPVARGITPSFILAGPTSDYSNNNTSITGSPAATSTKDASGNHTFTFATPVPRSATGHWTLGVNGRRQGSAVLYTVPAVSTDPGTFNWPYTGETVSEWMSNDVWTVSLDSGTLSSDPLVGRRSVVDQASCEKCHLELSLHGGNRHDVPICLLCHTPDATDWNVRPRDTRPGNPLQNEGAGTVLLNTPIDASATSSRWGYATLDGLEERSINFKTMLHRIHTGEREGVASLEGIVPYVVYGRASSATAAPNPFFFDDIRFPNQLGNCEVCHLKDTWTIEHVPPDAASTKANESGRLLHTATVNSLGSLTSFATWDGVLWTPRYAPPVDYTSIAWNGTRFAAVGASAAATSTDGATWTTRTIPAGNYAAVAWNGTEFVAVGSGASSGNAASASADGVTWSARTVPATYTALAWGGATWVAVGNGVAATSPDGITWTARTIPTGSYTGVVWTGARFAAVGNGVAVTSPDGVTWTAATIPSVPWAAIASSGTTLSAVGGNGYVATSSDGGATWAAGPTPLTNGVWKAIGWSGTAFVAVGTGLAATSADGITWTGSNVASGNYTSVAAGGGRLVAVGGRMVAVVGHSSSDPEVLPVTGACLTCHTSGAAADHAAAKTVGGVEQCGTCHGENGAESVRRHHAVP